MLVSNQLFDFVICATPFDATPETSRSRTGLFAIGVVSAPVGENSIYFVATSEPANLSAGVWSEAMAKKLEPVGGAAGSASMVPAGKVCHPVSCVSVPVVTSCCTIVIFRKAADESGGQDVATSKRIRERWLMAAERAALRRFETILPPELRELLPERLVIAGRVKARRRIIRAITTINSSKVNPPARCLGLRSFLMLLRIYCHEITSSLPVPEFFGPPLPLRPVLAPSKSLPSDQAITPRFKVSKPAPVLAL